MRRRSCLFWAILFLSALAVLTAFNVIPMLAEQSYGPPSLPLGDWQRFHYSAALLWNTSNLTLPMDPYGAEQAFVVVQGESIASISTRLQEAGLIRSPYAFRVYLIYTGLDTTIQSGTFRLSPAMTAREIAHALQDSTPTEVTFYILPGWRMEEIAAALPTSGLNVTPEAFLSSARSPRSAAELLPAGASAEGFLFPDAYTLPRNITADQLISVMLQNFILHLTPDLRDGFARQGLDVYQAVTLASIVEREAVVEDEHPLIASVFLNRLAIGMRLDSDPTVQYALGYNAAQGTWWTNPLSWEDLQVDSPYNTRVYSGLPPAPICNPSLSALQAVAYPAQTPYYYFLARCDGSGRHAFAETYEQHLQNACP